MSVPESPAVGNFAPAGCSRVTTSRNWSAFAGSVNALVSCSSPVTEAPCLADELLERVAVGRARVLRGDDDDAALVERARDDLRSHRPGERVRVGQPRVERVALRFEIGDLRAEVFLLVREPGQQRTVERGRAQHHADGQRQEARGDGNDVVPQGNHVKRPFTQATNVDQVCWIHSR